MTLLNPRLQSERGVALIVVLMLSTVVAALTMTLTLSGQTHVAIAHNHEMAARARTAPAALGGCLRQDALAPRRRKGHHRRCL